MLHFVLDFSVEISGITVSLEWLNSVVHDDLAGIDMLAFQFQCFLFEFHVPFLHVFLNFGLAFHIRNELFSQPDSLLWRLMKVFGHLFHQSEICSLRISQPSHLTDLRNEVHLLISLLILDHKQWLAAFINFNIIIFHVVVLE